jgi:predicted Fe-Mo cluster-binding NifX family protein
MKLCITASGKEIEAKIDPRFGRAPYFLIVDTESGGIEVVENSAAQQVQGAGTGAAQLVIDKGADALFTGRLGPNALNVLQVSGIKFYEGLSPDDTVQGVVEKFKAGGFSGDLPTSGVAQQGQVGDMAPGAGAGAGMGRGCGRGMGGGGRGMGGGGRGMGGGGRGMGGGGRF